MDLKGMSDEEKMETAHRIVNEAVTTSTKIIRALVVGGVPLGIPSTMIGCLIAAHSLAAMAGMPGENFLGTVKWLMENFNKNKANATPEDVARINAEVEAVADDIIREAEKAGVVELKSKGTVVNLKDWDTKEVKVH